MPTRCPRCGRFRRETPPAFFEPQVQPVCATSNPLEYCYPPETIPEELYAGIRPQTVCATCCDSLYGCREYNLDARNPFWPDFCHPRWLPCEQLYNGYFR